jgi:cobalamin-dependent methionine synthase I
MLAVDLVYKANEQNIPNERIWIDPIVTPISGDINQLKSCVEFLSMLPDIAPGCRSVVGLSNVSNGTQPHLRPYLNRIFLIMLLRAGLYAAIVDAFDSELIDVARGKRPELVSLVHRSKRRYTDMASLGPEEVKYAKTVRVLTAILFTPIHGWNYKLKIYKIFAYER